MRGWCVVSVMTAVSTFAFGFVFFNVSTMANSVSPLSIASSITSIAGCMFWLSTAASPSGISTSGISLGPFILIRIDSRQDSAIRIPLSRK